MSGQLTHIGVNLLPEAARELASIVAANGCSYTDAVNHAIMLCAELRRRDADGERIMSVRRDDTAEELVLLF